FLSSEARLFLPIRSRPAERTPQQRHSDGGGTHMIARLKPGATMAEAQSQIDAHNAAVEEDNPEAKMMTEAGFRSLVRPLHAEHVRSIRPTLLLMQAGADRSRGRRSSRNRDRGADRLVQPEQPSGACAPIGITHRHG